jgi:hypothetical protein
MLYAVLQTVDLKSPYQYKNLKNATSHLLMHHNKLASPNVHAKLAAKNIQDH